MDSWPDRIAARVTSELTEHFRASGGWQDEGPFAVETGMRWDGRQRWIAVSIATDCSAGTGEKT